MPSNLYSNQVWTSHHIAQSWRSSGTFSLTLRLYDLALPQRPLHCHLNRASHCLDGIFHWLQLLTAQEWSLSSNHSLISYWTKSLCGIVPVRLREIGSHLHYAKHWTVDSVFLLPHSHNRGQSRDTCVEFRAVLRSQRICQVCHWSQ